MNIFFLAAAFAKAAELHCDKHVVKMILETTQILCTVLSMLDIMLPQSDDEGDDIRQYNPTHRHHESVLWVLGGRSHFEWLLSLGLALCKRYTQIYGKKHSCERLLRHIQDNVCEDQLPPDVGVHAWLRRLAYMGVPDHVVEKCELRVALTNCPVGCGFGVFCVESKEDDVSVEDIVHKNALGFDVDLVLTYRNYYAFKAKRRFPMKWNRNPVPPEDLSSHMEQFLPDESAMLTKPRTPPKRPAEEPDKPARSKRRRANVPN